MKVGDIYQTRTSGAVEVVFFCGYNEVYVMFKNTGFIKRSSSRAIRAGSIKDPFLPSVYGVGYIGVGPYGCSKKGLNYLVYKVWQGMIARCYDPVTQSANPTYKGCKVCKEWHNLQHFARWFFAQDYKGKQLDKDIKVKGNKIYGPDYCKMVSQKDNNEQAIAKSYVFKSPSGDIVNVYNLLKFSRDNNISSSKMYDVSAGRRGQHKGWTLFAGL